MSKRSILNYHNLLCAIDDVLDPQLCPGDCLTAENARARLALARAFANYDLVPSLEGPLRAWSRAYARASGGDDPDYIAALEVLRAARAASKEAP